MKTYKRVEMEAVNAPTGSYAAGCPEHHHMRPGVTEGPGWQGYPCSKCEVAS